MRELATLTFVTLDGVMQSQTSPEEDPSGGFTGGGWAADYWEGVMAKVKEEAMATPYDILFGRKTYELFAAFWPQAGADNPEARMMNAARKYVATNSLTELEWQNSIVVSGDIPSEVVRLKGQDGPLIQIHGSGALIRSLLAANLIDELRLWTFPVIAGAGRRLFAVEGMPERLQLKKTAACANGVVMSIYRAA